jgi:hypothetical protein
MTQTESPAKGTLWAGHILSGLIILMLTMDGIMKLIKPIPAPVVEAMVKLGYPPDSAFGIGLLLLVCVVLYAIPRTSVLGAILLTGYLGGAVASHVRTQDGLFPMVFPSIVGILMWGGLFLRNAQLRALLTGQHKAYDEGFPPDRRRVASG